MMQPAPSKTRTEMIDHLKNDLFDVLIIGGGITGAGIALDAANRGLKVALIEKNDFASGTSSKSTKLIHGGLRYLKQFDFWLVKEVGTERAIVHKLAPHLVVPEKMLLPIIQDGTYGAWLTSFGLKIYDLLAQVEGDDKRKMLDKNEALELESLLPESILKGAGYYAEYRTDDARLTIEVLKTALKYSATTVNYCEGEEFIYSNKKLIGLRAKDTFQNSSFDIQAKYIINAAGPWVDTLRKLNKKNKTKPIRGKTLRLTKGVHLVFPHEKFPVKQSVYFDVPDGRMMFAIPRGKITYIGTTDTSYFGDIDDVRVTRTDAIYLISAVNLMFPSIELKLEDIQSSWAGLRPLIHEEGKSAGELSRKDEIFESKSGLISIAGGKLTGYRKMAERVTDLICDKINIEYDVKTKPGQTENLMLVGGNFNNYQAVEKYSGRIFNQLKIHGIQKSDVKILIHQFGKQTDLIVQKFNQLTDHDAEIRLAKAELWFCLNYEMTLSPLDFFIRRTGRLYFDLQSVEKLKQPIFDEFSNHFNWNPEKLSEYMHQLDQEIYKANNFE